MKDSRGARTARVWIQQITESRHGIPPDHEESKRILDYCFCNRPCNDCGAALGQPHEHGCDVERCQYTGAQWIGCGGQSHWRRCDCEDDNGYEEDGYTIHSCGQVPHDCGSEIWDGVWPGVAEAVEFGWFSMFVPSVGWARCGPGDIGAGPNLNRLYGGECRWDRKAARWVKR